jgi:hypothetical protein
MAQNIYDDPEFFAGYSGLPRSVKGLAGAAGVGVAAGAAATVVGCCGRGSRLRLRLVLPLGAGGRGTFGAGHRPVGPHAGPRCRRHRLTRDHVRATRPRCAGPARGRVPVGLQLAHAALPHRHRPTVPHGARSTHPGRPLRVLDRAPHLHRTVRPAVRHGRRPATRHGPSTATWQRGRAPRTGWHPVWSSSTAPSARTSTRSLPPASSSTPWSSGAHRPSRCMRCPSGPSRSSARRSSSPPPTAPDPSPPPPARAVVRRGGRGSRWG